MDRLTQLQECSLKVSELLYTAIGALQRDAPLVELDPSVPVTCWTEDQIKKNWEGNVELSKIAARDIVETSKVIDYLIESLPGISNSEGDQLDELSRLEQENIAIEEELTRTVTEGGLKLQELRESIRLIINQQKKER
jgi:mediator of RNA polymerase II transcription subunit 21